MKKHINSQTIKLYWRQIRKYKPSFFIALVAIPLAGIALDTGLPYALSLAVGSFSSGTGDLNRLLILASVFALSGVLLNAAGFVAKINHESKVRADIVIDTLDNLLRKDVGFFANQKIGALTGRFIDFTNAHLDLQNLLIVRTLTFILNVGLGTLIIFLNTPLLGIIVLALIISLLAQIRLSIYLRRDLRKARKSLIGKVNGAAADTISNNQTVKAFANEAYELSENRKINDKYRQASSKDFRWMVLEGSGRLLLMSGIQILSISIVAGLLLNHQISLGIAIFVVAYLQRIAAQLFVLGEMINGYDKLLLQAAPITEMLGDEPKIVDTPNAKDLVVSRAEIRFINTDFAYDDAPNISVLSAIDLTIRSGEKVGVVGPSGAGKTTITKLLMRFNDASGGSITIDGQDIAKVTQRSLRSSIAFVPQEPMLFHRSLRENVAYGKLDATESEIILALKSANAYEFVDKLPDGLDTIVGERGVKLSGGQRQRIAIARAILKNAPILILDEATSSLDSVSERLIQNSLETLMTERTSIVIAHRLSTIAKLDRIIVIDQGKVMEDGSHQRLLALNGIYAKLWKHQSGGFIEAE